ncbi:PBP1A family penicillin-binding protein [Paenibacillus sp. GCM10023252]|uniref:PBP1A family penicillin-binding protein n=1 Tax=Paenibacillus sp. GCM10023252 TaxID=3252649 RepID=UPI00360F01BE
MADRPRNNKTTARNKKKVTPRKLFFGLFFTAAIAIVCGIVGYLLIILNGERILTENKDKLFMGEASIIYDVNKKEIAKLSQADQKREIADFAELPKQLQNAFVAVEDQRFYGHKGIDFFSIGRAVVKDVIARSAVEGGSTITQQLAKNMFLSADKTFFRKATEASIATALENNFTKDEILTMYLNRIFFGSSGYGIKGASKYYFNKEPKDLELWQMATLAGMPKAPNRYSPIANPEESMARRAIVLQLMYDQKYITEAEMIEAKAVQYVAPPNRGNDNGKSQQFTAFIDYAVEEAVRVTKKTEEELRVGGYHIYTTLNPRAQTAVEAAFADDDNFENSPDDTQVQGAMIIMDHRDGTIQAMQGGRDYVAKGLNRVEVPRQPGSAFKPIVSYGPALETGDYFPWTTLKNDKKCFGSDYCPKDSRGTTPISMQQAVKESRNLPTVWLLNEIGVKTGINFANKLGFNLGSEDRNLAIALGGLNQGVTPLQMAGAYSTFANNGRTVDAHAIIRIQDKDNKPMYEYEAPAGKQVMKKETAWYTTEMLQGVVQKGGTGTSARISRPVAGKTGTTQHGIPGFNSSANRDAWFVGYTPEWTAAVWMGYDKTDRQHVLKKGSVQSAEMFAKVMSAAMKGVPESSFKKPSGVKENKAPDGVAGLNAEFIPEEMKVKLTWDAKQDSNVTYRVFRKETGAADFVPFVDGLAGNTVDDMSIFPGVSYEYYVTAYDSVSKLESKPSNRVTIAVPEAEIEVPEVPMEPEPTDPNGEVSPSPDGGDPGNGDGNGGNGNGNGNGEEPEQPGDGGEVSPSPTPTPSPSEDDEPAVEESPPEDTNLTN